MTLFFTSRHVKRQHVNIVMLFILFFSIAAANAQLTFCNRTNAQISVAIMRPVLGQQWVTQGWFNYSPGECRAPVSTPGDLKYYYYARRDDGSTWAGTGPESVASCIKKEAGRFLYMADGCGTIAGTQIVNFRPVNKGGATEYTVSLTHTAETVDFSDRAIRARACEILNLNLDRPRLRSEKVVIGHYTDVFTRLQTRSECTNTYDTGVPDPSSCRLEYDKCADEWEIGPARGCIPGTTARCSSNIKLCNTWKTEKRTMECDITFQLKLPNFVEAPIEQFLDNGLNVINESRRLASDSLPLQCAPAASSQSPHDVAGQIVEDLKNKVRSVIEREAREWLTETAIETVAASIPSGGIAGTAVMTTQLAQFVYRTQRALRPVIKVANDVKNFSEDVGFNTSCGWSDWHRAF